MFSTNFQNSLQVRGMLNINIYNRYTKYHFPWVGNLDKLDLHFIIPNPKNTFSSPESSPLSLVIEKIVERHHSLPIKKSFATWPSTIYFHSRFCKKKKINKKKKETFYHLVNNHNLTHAAMLLFSFGCPNTWNI